jgi:hypothetical protein
MAAWAVAFACKNNAWQANWPPSASEWPPLSEGVPATIGSALLLWA